MRGVVATVLGCVLLTSSATAQTAGFWVVGSAAKGCRIVEQNPVIYLDGDVTFSDGPYRSMDDAKLAMTTISVCKT